MPDLDFSHANIQGFISELNQGERDEQEPSFVGTIDKQISINMPVGIVAYVDAMTLRFPKSGATRSSLIREILRSAIYDIFNKLDEEVKMQIEHDAKECLANVVPENMKSVAARFSLDELCDVVEV